MIFEASVNFIATIAVSQLKTKLLNKKSSQGKREIRSAQLSCFFALQAVSMFRDSQEAQRQHPWTCSFGSI